ncbi:NAD-dependent epimerase/dehydratase family protein [Marinobacter zhejiangensis]|uniref:Nucleoside-diphosphate-sugar epimerase n=1 Tax=Marinobacter zhejiangensis TaxID=488535 RepID=A0A1I4Q769_9GAMM|nr:NAD-dependent epimerase/dehydratase family protein [Marinobacter zhejiangensis]SFM35656.1 Nucleoside-diphosphate-sugar epimerase [Marinobacter zhejiangensis]
MTILITGATGFIGRHLCAHLTANQVPVVALMRNPEKLTSLRQQVTALDGQGDLISVISGDLDQPGLGLKQPMPQGIRAIVHLGARFAWGMAPETAQRTNVNGSLAVAQLARQLQCRLVYVSGFMLENTDHLARLGINLNALDQTDWNTVYQRAGSYEASKLEGALKTRVYADKHAMDWVEIQPATLTGSVERGELDPAQPLFQLIDNLNHGRLAMVPGTAKDWLPLVSVDTLVRLISAAIEAQNPPPRLLALDPATPNLKGLLALLAKPLDRQAPARHIPKKLLALLLKIPGLATKLNTAPESLHFIQPARFDTGVSMAFMAQHSISMPAIEQVVLRNARWYHQRC